MRQEQRDALRRKFGFRCGYCGVAERDVGAELTVDHFQPRSRGGLHDPDNWVYCCHPCNEFKGDYWQPESPQRVLHPLRDDIALHMAHQDDGSLRALSATGAFHIERLRLNRSQLIAYRRERRLLEAAREVQSRLLDRLASLDEQVQTLTSKLERLRGAEPDI
jgi:hypothetical protein